MKTLLTLAASLFCLGGAGCWQWVQEALGGGFSAGKGLGFWEMGPLGPEQEPWVEVRSLSLGADSMSICEMLHPGTLPGYVTSI